MSIQNFVPTIWNAAIQRTLHRNLVAKKICNREAEGSIKKSGDTVYFNGLVKPTITAYTGSVSYEGLVSARVALQIDQASYFAFEVTDIQEAQANVSLKGSQATEAAYGLQESADTYVLGLYANANRTITDTTLDSATVISVLGTAAQYLAEADVKMQDMWMVIPPWIRLKLQLAGIKFQINDGLKGEGGIAWTDELGFDIYVTNQVKNTGTLASPVSECMAGSYNSIVYADQILDTETMRLEGKFATVIRGLNTYGAKIIRPEQVVRITATYVAETAI